MCLRKAFVNKSTIRCIKNTNSIFGLEKPNIHSGLSFSVYEKCVSISMKENLVFCLSIINPSLSYKYIINDKAMKGNDF